jgi:hypothetical protein
MVTGGGPTYADGAAGRREPVAICGVGTMGRQTVTRASQAMLHVLPHRRDGTYDVADAFMPLIEYRAAQGERVRILEAVLDLPVRGGYVELQAVLRAIGPVRLPDLQLPSRRRDPAQASGHPRRADRASRHISEAHRPVDGMLC